MEREEVDSLAKAGDVQVMETRMAVDLSRLLMYCKAVKQGLQFASIWLKFCVYKCEGIVSKFHIFVHNYS